MLKASVLARLVIPVLVATAFQTLVAGEPVGTTPMAGSIREWKTNSTAKPTEAQTLVAGESVGAAPMSRSIREWKTNSTAKPTATPAAAPCGPATPAPPAVQAVVPKSPITISLTSTMLRGKLVVVLDDVPVFTEQFQKPFVLIYQTTTWDPVQVTPGKHKLSAKVYGTKKTYLSAIYDLEVSPTKASGLRFLMKGDRLTVEVAS